VDKNKNNSSKDIRSKYSKRNIKKNFTNFTNINSEENTNKNLHKPNYESVT